MNRMSSFLAAASLALAGAGAAAAQQTTRLGAPPPAEPEAPRSEPREIIVERPGQQIPEGPAPRGVTIRNGVLTDPYGLPLYVYDEDEPGVSHCHDRCARTWPPLYATRDSVGDGDWLAFARGDGTRQWAYKGRPLYTWRNDFANRPPAGQGQPGWSLARVDSAF